MAKQTKWRTTLNDALRKEFRTVCRNSADLNQFLENNKIDANATLFKPSPNDKYFHYLFLDCIGNKDSVEVFVKRNVTINLTGYNGRGVLQHCYYNSGDFDSMKLLLENGANPNLADWDGNTALIERVRFFSDGLTMDQMVNGKYEHLSKDWNFLLSFIEILLEYGANPLQKNKYGTSAMDWIEHRKEEGEFHTETQRLEQLLLKYCNK